MLSQSHPPRVVGDNARQRGSLNLRERAIALPFLGEGYKVKCVTRTHLAHPQKLHARVTDMYKSSRARVYCSTLTLALARIAWQNPFSARVYSV